MYLNSVNIYILPRVGREEVGKFEEECSPLSDWMNETICGAGDGDDVQKG